MRVDPMAETALTIAERVGLAAHGTPLTLWTPAKAESPSFRGRAHAALDTAQCHAKVTISGRMTSWHQCDRPHKTERPMRVGLGIDKEIVVRPVCGVHARVFDKAIDNDEKRNVERAAEAALHSQLKTLVNGAPWADAVFLIGTGTAPRVSVPLEAFKALMEAWRPRPEPAKGDLVAFIVRDGTRIRHQGTGNGKSVDAKGVHLTDGASGKRFVVPVIDVRVKTPKEQR
jgi:hypothetical protein